MSNTKIFIENPQSRPQGVGLPKGSLKPILFFHPGVNEIDKVDWDTAMKNKTFVEKVNMGYLRVMTDVATEEKTDKPVISAAIIASTYDIPTLEKWLKNGDLKTPIKNKIKAQIKQIKDQTQADDAKIVEGEDSGDLNDEIRNYE